MITDEQRLYYNFFLDRTRKIEDYKKCRGLHESIDRSIGQLTETVSLHQRARNPRQDMQQRLDCNKLRILKQRKERMVEILKSLEITIANDLKVTFDDFLKNTQHTER